MAVILNIGYTHFLLPESANVNLIIKSLSHAKKLEREYDQEKGKYFYYHNETMVDIEVKIVSSADIIPAEKPEKIPPQHNLLFHPK